MELWEKHRSALLAVAAIALVYLVFGLIGLGCPIKFTTGVSCAGCGMTRAYLRLLHLDFVEAFYFHPLFWAVPVAVVAYLLRRRFPRSARAVLIVIAALFVLVYVIRMLDPGCDVVVFEPRQNVFYRTVRRLRGGVL